MQFTTILSAVALLGAVSAAPLELTKRNLPTLDDAQNRNANAIINEVRNEGLNTHACQTVIVTALQESQIYIYANPAVPASMNYPHDQVGGDQDSVGIFQQRPEWYPNIAADMDPAQSAGLFLQQMKNIQGWQNIDPATLAQDVQKSEYPDRYQQQVGRASQICSAAGYN